MANEAASADQSRTTWTRHLQYDSEADRREIVKIEQAIHSASAGDYETLEVDLGKLTDELLRSLSAYLNIDFFEARSLISRLLSGFSAAVYKTDWRLGYGKVRKDATVPEAAAHLVIAAIELLNNAFSSGGIRAYRNRHHAFIEAMAEFAAQANGSVAANASFYEQLGRRVAREVLDHQLTSPRPQLAPEPGDYDEIEVAALEQLVYFIQVGEAGAIKIGIARDPATRLAGLQTGHHEELRMLAITVGGAEQERLYHDQFAAHRLRGEWFSPHPDILAEIDRLSA